jgi:hypothetical protein
LPQNLPFAEQCHALQRIQDEDFFPRAILGLRVTARRNFSCAGVRQTGAKASIPIVR